jgi:YidC/Oxa1 family membrane protein insertase
LDKKTLPIIIALAVLIIFYYPILQFLGVYDPPEPKPQAEQVETADTSSGVTLGDTATLPLQKSSPSPIAGTAELSNEQQAVRADTVIIITNQYELGLSTHGGGNVFLYLNNYNYRDGERINMLTKAAAATPDFTFAGETFSTANVNFTSNLSPGEYTVSSEPLELVYTFTRDGGELVKRYRFYPDDFHFDLHLEIRNREKFGFERSYGMVWNTPPDVTEPQADADYQEMSAVAMMAGSRVTLDDFNDDILNQSLDGLTSWAGVRSKYFASVIIPKSRPAERVFARGQKMKIPSGDTQIEAREITAGLTFSFANVPTITDSFSVYVGPLDYEIMAEYDVDLEDILGIGTTPFVGWIIKPFALAIIWLLPRMYNFIPNYGICIIIFALLVKLITLPLSMKSFKSMQAMKDLQPKIEELKQKHKKNPQAMNQEMMKMYKAHGVNPLSGCLPILPQMPLFFALFSVFRSTILLRDAPFVWFINDLSRGASSFTDPYIILVVIMVAAQFVSQKFTMTSTQQNKIFMYIMPLFMGFIFYKFAAGLVLYWACFSIFSLLDYLLFKKPKVNSVQTA